MGGVGTQEQAENLPEIKLNDSFGTPLMGVGMNSDDIILFVDNDGRAMQVVETENGPAKMEFF